MDQSLLQAISPLDGRYAKNIQDIRVACSESALIQRRLRVEIAWICHLADTLPELKGLSAADLQYINGIADDDASVAAIKDIENTLRHDVKSVEVFLAEKFALRESLKPYISFLHFACTSEDINNICYALMLKELRDILLVDMDGILVRLNELARDNAKVAMLARTHGQAASPTTMGKEMAVFAYRLLGQLPSLQSVALSAKFNGATGNYNAHLAAYPDIDWPAVNQKFIESLGLEAHPCTTQIEPQDDMAAMLHSISRLNTILLDACRDLWGYISLGYFKLAVAKQEVGSSTMPHKVNPIDFENAEGNLGIANAMLQHLASSLPVSRWQRDLSGSTRLRNIGPAIGHSVLAWRNMLRGLNLLAADEQRMLQDLQAHPEVLAEAVQTVMRKYGMADAYDRLKQFSRGAGIDQQQLQQLIDSLDIPDSEKQNLRQLATETYTGNAAEQAIALAADLKKYQSTK